MKRKQALALFLAAVMLFTAAACGGRTGKTETGTKPAGGSARPITDTGLLPLEMGEKTHLKAFSDVTPAAERPYTLLVYMIGADLESDGAAASYDIREMIDSAVDSDSVNLLLYAGGTELWHNGIPTDANYLYRYDTDEETMLSVAATKRNYSMGAAQTLTDVLDFTVQYYPAARYGLIFWDHGSGSVFGYGADMLFDDDSLELRELSAALNASAFGADAHLDFIGFDACLMGTLETAIAVAPYADYLIGSEELEPGTGWDYAALTEMTGGEDAKTLARRFIDGFAESELLYQTYADYIPDLTLACLDLSRVETVTGALDALAAQMQQSLGSQYGEISRIRSRTKEFSADYGLDQIDLLHFATLAAERWDEAETLADAVRDMVVYERANVTNANGLSFYFPFFGESVYLQYGSDALRQTYADHAYSDFISAFMTAKHGGKTRSHPLQRETAAEDVITLALTEEELTTLDAASYSVYIKMDDGKYEPVLLDMPVTPDANGVLSIPAQQNGMYMRNDSGGRSLFPVRLTEDGTDRRSFSATLVFSTDVAYLPYVESDRCEILLSVPTGGTSAAVRSIRITDGEGHGDKKEVDLTDRSSVFFVSHSYEPTTDDDGTMLPFSEWEASSTTWITYMDLGNGLQFSFEPLDTMADSFVLQFKLRDVYGTESCSALFEPKSSADYTLEEVDVPDGKLTFAVFDDHAKLMRLNGDVKDLTVPGTVKGKPVTEIGYSYYNAEAILSNTNTVLETLVLPDSVERIDYNAFASCRNLRSVKLPAALKSIGAQAFSGTSLEEIDLPDTLESIGNSAFRYCCNSSWDEDFNYTYTGIREVRLPASLRFIGEGAFSDCGNLVRFLADGNANFRVTDGVLFTKDGETLLCYPAGKTEETYTLPESVKRIGTGAFCGCKALQHVKTDEALREIAPYAFYECEQLSACELHDRLEWIGAYTFCRNTLLAFDPVPHMEEIYLGPLVTHVGKAAFRGTRTERFTVAEGNTTFSANGNLLLDKSGTVLLCADIEDEIPLVIPDGVVTVMDDALSGCDNITELTLPDSVVNFKFQTFSSDLRKVTIGAGVKNIVAWTFGDNVEFVLSPENPWLELRDGKLFTKDGKDLSVNS